MSTKQAAKDWLSKAITKTKSVVLNKPKWQLLAEDATGPEPWGPTGQQMGDIAEACFDAEKFRQVWGVLLKRFELEPAEWRRIYKALLLTEHLIKNSSQHVVQTILDHMGVLEGLKQFKGAIDEKCKDSSINVSNRAKELVLLLNDPERIRAERAKAKATRSKFTGVSREDMAAAMAASGGGMSGGMGSSMGGSAQYGDSSSSRHFDDIGGSSRFAGGSSGSSAGGSPRPGRQALPAEDGGHLGLAGQGEVGGEARPVSDSRMPSKVYGSLAADAPGDDPVAATAQRINSLRQAGMLSHDDLATTNAAVHSSSPSGGPTTAGSMHGSRSCDDLSVAQSAGSQSGGKPSLQELMARRAGPKKLAEVRVNPSIAAAIGGIKLPAAGGVAPSLPKHTPAVLPPPPAAPAASQAPPASSTAAATGGPAAPAALAELLSMPAASATHSQSHSPVAHISGTASGTSSSAATPSGTGSPAFGAFGSGGSAAGFGAFSSGSPTGPSSPSAAAADSFGAFSTKPGAAAAGTINLTASARAFSPQALPVHLFAEPTPVAPPAYNAAASWGTHVAGAAPKPAAGVGGNPFGSSATAATKAASPTKPADELFSDFSPFK